MRLLDVGNVRVDGGGLWPDEALEAPMLPVYACMSLEQLVGSTSRMLGHQRLKARGCTVLALGATKRSPAGAGTEDKADTKIQGTGSGPPTKSKLEPLSGVGGEPFSLSSR